MPGEYADLETSEVIAEKNAEYGLRSPSGSSDDGSEARTSLIMADRKYLASVFKNVYGPDYDKNNFVNRNIMTNQEIFGAPCDIYEVEYKENSRSVIDQSTRCHSQTWNTDHSVGSTTLRQGWITRTCEQYSARKVFSSYALTNAGIDISEDNFSYAKVDSLYKLFSPQRKLHLSIYNVLMQNKGSLTNDEFWKATLTAFCISPDWQHF